MGIELIGKEWQDLGWVNGWVKDGIEYQICRECRKRGYKFKEVYHNPRGYTYYESEEAMVKYSIDSSD